MEETEEIKEAKKIAKMARNLSDLSHTPGGKLLVDRYTKKIVSLLELMAYQHKTLSHLEMVAIGAQLFEYLEIVRTLTRADEAKNITTEELETIIKETLHE